MEKEIDNSTQVFGPYDCQCDQPAAPSETPFSHTNKKCPLTLSPIGMLAQIYRLIRTYEEGLERADYDLLSNLKHSAKMALTKDQVATLEKIVEDMKTMSESSCGC